MSLMTIREVARTGILSQHRLRERLKQKRLPGIYCGTRFYVDIESLQKLLQEEALENYKRNEGQSEV